MTTPVPADLSAAEAPHLAQLLAWGLLAGAGGAVRFVSVMMRTKGHISSRRFLVLLVGNVFVSGFSGLIGALAFSTFSSNHIWQMIAAGVFGYGGTQVLDFLALAMQRKVAGTAEPVSAAIPIPPSVDPALPQA